MGLLLGFGLQLWVTAIQSVVDLKSAPAMVLMDWGMETVMGWKMALMLVLK